jgi:O-antigen ligase
MRRRFSLPYVSDRRTELPAWIAFATAVAASIFVCAQQATADGKYSLPIAFLVAGLPLVATLLLRQPLILYYLFAFLVPFDNILSIAAGQTLTKLVGFLAAASVLFYGLRTKRFVRPTAAMMIWVPYLLWATISLQWALDLPLANRALVQMVTLFLLYLVLATQKINRKDLNRIAFSIVGGGIIAGSYAVYLFRSGAPVNPDSTMSRLIITNSSGQAGIDPNHFSNALLLPIALLTMAALRSRSVILKPLLAAGVLVMVAAIYLSASREALLGVGVLMLYFFWKTRYRVQLASLLGIAALLSGALTSSIWTRLGQAQQTGGSGRLAIWSVGFEAFKHRWLTGYGIGSFAEAYNTAFIKVAQTYSGGWERASHNIVVGCAVELGVVGVVLLLTGWALQFRVLRIVPKESPLYELRIALQGACLVLFLTAMFIDSFNYKYVWLTFALIAQTRAVEIRERGARRGKLRARIDPPGPVFHHAAPATRLRLTLPKPH